MARPSLRCCNELGCPELAYGPKCDAHKRPAWAGTTDRLRGWARRDRNERVLARHGRVCHTCGMAGATEVDHVVPLAQGGADDETNLRPIHREPCHRDKTARESAAGRRR
jgi:5-methylcytosine-specific restriction endonuclease McrA